MGSRSIVLLLAAVAVVGGAAWVLFAGEEPPAEVGRPASDALRGADAGSPERPRGARRPRASSRDEASTVKVVDRVTGRIIDGAVFKWPSDAPSVTLPADLGGIECVAEVERTRDGIRLLVDAFCRLELSLKDEAGAAVKGRLRISAVSPDEGSMNPPVRPLLESAFSFVADDGEPRAARRPRGATVRSPDVDVPVHDGSNLDVAFDGDVSIVFIADAEHRPVHRTLRARRGDAIDVSVGFRRRARVSGRVLDEDGRSVAKARVLLGVRLERSRDEPSMAIDEALSMIFHRGEDTALILVGVGATTDDEGEFSSLISYTSELSCACFHDSLGAAVWVSSDTRGCADQTDITLRLAHGPSRWVRVVDASGSPDAGRSFEVRLARSPPVYVNFPLTTADADGWLDTSFMVPGERYELAALPQQSGRPRRDFVLEEGLTIGADD